MMNDSSGNTRPPSKNERFLAELLQGPRSSRELELAPVFDHCANSTASEMRSRGVAIRSELIEVPGYHGKPARIARYEIEPSGMHFARALLARLKERRCRGRA